MWSNLDEKTDAIASLALAKAVGDVPFGYPFPSPDHRALQASLAEAFDRLIESLRREIDEGRVGGKGSRETPGS